MDERREPYHAVNGQWPQVVPPLTGPEAIAAAKRLYRFAMKKSWKGKWKLTSGRRYTWPRGGTFFVNPDRTDRAGRSELDHGWRDLVHMMSHYCHSRLHPGKRSHDGRHHFIEKEMVAYVIEHKWLDGRLRPKVRPVIAKSAPAARLPQIEAATKRWTTKLRRAETALRKLKRQRAYYTRRQETVNPPAG